MKGLYDIQTKKVNTLIRCAAAAAVPNPPPARAQPPPPAAAAAGAAATAPHACACVPTHRPRRVASAARRPDGQKKAYVRLMPDNDALDVANKIGII